MKYSAFPPAEVRALIRAGKLDAPTTGYCDGYAQGNLVVLPKARKIMSDKNRCRNVPFFFVGKFRAYNLFVLQLYADERL